MVEPVSVALGGGDILFLSDRAGTWQEGGPLEISHRLTFAKDFGPFLGTKDSISDSVLSLMCFGVDNRAKQTKVLCFVFFATRHMLGFSVLPIVEAATH